MKKEEIKPSIGKYRAKLSHRERRLNFNYWRKYWNLEESIIKRGEEQHLTLVPGLGRESRVQPAFIEEGSQSLSSSSLVSYVFQLLWYYV